MTGRMNPRARVSALLFLALAACGESNPGPVDGGSDDSGTEAGPLYSVGAVVQDPEGRTLYLHTVSSLDQDLTNDTAVEVPGNSRHWAYEGAVYVALAEAPEIVKYVPDAAGVLTEAGRVSFGSYGLASIPAGNAFISPTKAYLFYEAGYQLLVWNPTTMTITASVSLASLMRATYSVELHMPVIHGTRVYVPVRYANFMAYEIVPDVNMLILDTDTDAVLGVASDDRCVAASTPSITADGTVYVAADGRSFLAQIVAMGAMQTPPPTCVLRILPGALDFDTAFLTDVPALTEGKELATALWTVTPGVAYARLFHEEDVPEGTMAYGTGFWSVPAFRLWRFTLGDTIAAEEVSGLPAAIIDFGGSEVDGHFYIGTATPAQETTVYEVDPATNTASVRFTMQGLLREIHRLR